MPLNTKDPRFQKLCLGLLGLAAFLYCFFFTDWVPFTYKANASQLGELESRYAGMSKDLSKARQSAHRLPYLEKEYDLLHRKWEQSKSLLPEDVDMAWCLKTITLLGTRAGVDFTYFKPGAAKPAQYHTETPIEIRVVGGYHQVGTFLGELANLDRIINVSDLEVVTSKEEDPEKPAEASFVAVTYTAGGTGVAPAPEEDPKGGAKKTGAVKHEKGSEPANGSGSGKERPSREHRGESNE